MKQQSLKIFSKEETGPYELPKGWRWVRLGEVCEINQNSRNPAKEIPDKEFLYIDITSVESGTGEIKEIKKILGKNAPSRARRVIHQDDVIMSTVRPYLKAFAVIPPEYDNQICSTGFAVLSCNSGILPKFLLYALFSEVVIEQCNKMMIGAHYPALNNEQVSEIKIPLPPLPEQKRIVARIEALFSKIDEIKRLRKEANDLAKTLMPSALHEVFSKADEKGWKWVRLGEILDLSNGKSITKKEMKEDGAYLVYGSNGVIGKANKYLINKDTIVIGRVGACGVVNIAKAPAWISDNAMYVSKLSDDIDILFLYYALTHLDLSRLAKIVAQPSISQEPIKEQKIPIPFKNRQPALDEQKRIVSYLDQISEKQKTLLKIYADIDNQITQLKQSILTKAFRGQLGKQNFNNDL